MCELYVHFITLNAMHLVRLVIRLRISVAKCVCVFPIFVRTPTPAPLPLSLPPPPSLSSALNILARPHLSAQLSDLTEDYLDQRLRS